MKRWVAHVLAIILCGCGNNESSNPSMFLHPSSQAGDTLNFTNKNTLEQSGLTLEFDVNLFTQSPLYKESKVYLSSQNVFRISLKTLDFLTEEKRFPLIEADEIISNGLPSVIPPKGYTARLEIIGNQVIVVMKSATAPEKPDSAPPLHVGNNDIVIGDLRRSLLLLKGTSNTLFFPKMKERAGFQTVNYFSSQGLNYISATQWFGQVETTQWGMDRFLSMSLGKCWDFPKIGNLHASIKHIYKYRSAHSLALTSIKYSALLFRGYEGHLIFTTTLAQPWNQAVGGGISFHSLPNEFFHMDVIISNKVWSLSAVYELHL